MPSPSPLSSSCSEWAVSSLPFEAFSDVKPIWGSPGGTSGEESICQRKRLERREFDPCVRKIPWNRKWHPTPVFLPGKFHGQRSLAAYSPRGCKESDVTGHILMQIRCLASAQLPCPPGLLSAWTLLLSFRGQRFCVFGTRMRPLYPFCQLVFCLEILIHLHLK